MIDNANFSSGVGAKAVTFEDIANGKLPSINYNNLLRQAYLFFGNYHMAEDAVQDLYLKMSRGKYDLCRRESLETIAGFIRVALENICKNIAIRTKRFLPLDNLPSLHPIVDERPYHYSVRKELEEEIDRAVSGLTPLERETFDLRIRQELPYKVISKRMKREDGTDTPENSLKRRVHYIRKKLKKAMSIDN